MFLPEKHIGLFPATFFHSLGKELCRADQTKLTQDKISKSRDLHLLGSEFVAEKEESMASDDVAPNFEWEKHKFAVETQLKERELQLATDRLRAESLRNILIGALVPIVVALMTGVPTYINSLNQQALQKATFEAQLIIDSVKTGDPDQAAVNLAFLVQSGLLSGQTATRVENYLKTRKPKEGRFLPAS